MSVKLIRLPQHSGKSSALLAGFRSAAFDIIATMDSDLQDDPFDLPKLIAKLQEGYDCVCGWRYEKASGTKKSLSSLIANRVRSGVLKDGIHDSNAPLKVMRKKS